MSEMPNRELRTDRAHNARAYDYLLGGKDNYAADRAMADSALRLFPGARISARANRTFMQRAARYLAEAGIDQFVDIGTGIPTEPNLHQVVQEIIPAARVVYVDNDPIVLAHAHALLVGSTSGSTSFVQADANDVMSIVNAEEVQRNIDRTRPVAVSLFAVLHFMDDEAATRLVDEIVRRAASGSYLAISHGTFDADRDGRFQRAVGAYAEAGVRMYPRSAEQLRELFLGPLEIVEPGIVMSHKWRPDLPTSSIDDADVAGLGVLARLP